MTDLADGVDQIVNTVNTVNKVPAPAPAIHRNFVQLRK